MLKDNTIAFDNVNKLPDGKNLKSDFEKIAENRDSKNENWTPVLGEKKILHQSLQRTFGYIESTQ